MAYFAPDGQTTWIGSYPFVFELSLADVRYYDVDFQYAYYQTQGYTYPPLHQGLLKHSVRLKKNQTSTSDASVTCLVVRRTRSSYPSSSAYTDAVVGTQTFTVPAGDTYSSSYISTAPSAPATGTAVGTFLVAANIVPDSNMAGVIGDVVKSAKPGSSIKHFVTPKKSTELNQDYVILKADGVSAEQITPGHAKQLVEWEGGEPVSGNPLKRRVPRAATGTGATEVKIRAKGGWCYPFSDECLGRVVEYFCYRHSY
jgi:hypothetical protein